MERRELLAGGSSLMAVALAGCAFDDESEASGPADENGETDDSNDDGTDDADDESEGGTDNETDDATDDNETVSEDNESDDATDDNETDDGTETDEEDEDGETGDDEEDDEDGETDDDEGEEPVLTVYLEDEDGEPVSEGVVVSITGESNGVATTHNRGGEIEDGQIEQLVGEGNWTVRVEPEEDGAFEPREEEVEVDGPAEVTMELGSSPDGESEETESEGGEDGGDDSEGGEDEEGSGTDSEDGDTDDDGDDAGDDEGDDTGDTDDGEDDDTDDSGETDTDETNETEDDDADADEETDETDDGDGADDDGTETDTDTDDEGADEGTDSSEDETGSAPGEIPGLDEDALAAGGEVLAEIEVERRNGELVITAVPVEDSDGPLLGEVSAALATTGDAISDPDALRSAIDRVTVVIESAEGEELFSASGGGRWLLAFTDGGSAVDGVAGLLGSFGSA